MVGRGLLGLMSKIGDKRTHDKLSPSICTHILTVVTLCAFLAGCGDISLGLLLVKQAPGELGIIPQTATISPLSSIEISGKGGFTPYTFSATAGRIEEIDGVTSYTAPSTPTPDVIITVVDTLANEAAAIIQVESPTNPFSFPEAMTIAVGESTGYVQAGGGDITVTGKYMTFGSLHI